MAIALKSQAWLSFRFAVRAKLELVVASALKHICASARLPRPTDSASQGGRRSAGLERSNPVVDTRPQDNRSGTIRPSVSPEVEFAGEGPDES